MPTIALGLIGAVMDSGSGPQRWQRWRPTVDLCRHDNLPIDRLELLVSAKFAKLAEQVREDIAAVSPKTTVRLHTVEFKDPWDFQEVYTALLDFARKFPFNPEKEKYLIHITTGTHVAQICLFLLTEAHYLPAKLVQTAPPRAARVTDLPDAPHAATPRAARASRNRGDIGTYSIIDLDLSKYDTIASRFHQEQTESLSFLKSGIDTHNSAFNQLIERIERVALASKAPLLLMGPTGSGKSLLARRIYELKKTRLRGSSPANATTPAASGGAGPMGAFVEVNCATLRGDAAMSALFGHVKGAFTGALTPRPGLLRAADGGILFLDEIGELGLDEQAMLLRALEEKVFLPLGSDKEASSNFQLIAGTNRDLAREVAQGNFRDDLFARINLWTFRLPPLRERPEDIEPNVEYELLHFARRENVNITFNKEARERFLAFAKSAAARWAGNFRDLSGTIQRLATLAHAGAGGSAGGRITLDLVEYEIRHLQALWSHTSPGTPISRLAVSATPLVDQYLAAAQQKALDPFDRIQLEEVLRICHESPTLSEAGRQLFAASRKSRKTANDADRLRKYLARFGLTWQGIH